ncbi:MAG: hypothetical protein JXX29_07655 [Deltaproteobacteria bacterium]|nr:hypothetical protein [Deltaproteobacteria bacterium]MBN2671532.1 hypothetical protein [Deltaproteobacteria bacterium]
MSKTAHLNKSVEIIKEFSRCEKCMIIAVNIIILAKPIIVILFHSLLTT